MSEEDATPQQHANKKDSRSTSKLSGSSSSEIKQPEDLPSLLQLLQIVSDHWSHAEQIRWTALYNFLVASTILILAWAAIVGSGLEPTWKFGISILFEAVGLVICFLWWCLGNRASGFVDTYAGLGLQIEDCLKEKEISKGIGVGSPFQTANRYRNEVTGLFGWATTRRLVNVVIGSFGIFYLFLIGFSVLMWINVNK